MSRVTKVLAIAFALSFTLNAFLVGAWAGRALKGGRTASEEPGEGAGAPIRRMMWHRHRALLEPHREAVERARHAVRDALLADPFLPEKLEATLGDLRAQTDEAQTALHRALVDVSRELGVEDRRRLAEARWFVGAGAGEPRQRSPR